MSESCIKTTLATFPYGNVQKCSCGGYYITFGYITLRLSYDELKSYTEMLNKVVGNEGFTKENNQDTADKRYQ